MSYILEKYIGGGEKINEQAFSVESAPNDLKKIESKINAPFVHAQLSTLGGKDRPSIIVRISLDPKNEWENRIYQNSRYFMVHYYVDGTMKIFSKSHVIQTKFRKQKAKTVDVFIKKINTFIDKAEKEV